MPDLSNIVEQHKDIMNLEVPTSPYIGIIELGYENGKSLGRLQMASDILKLCQNSNSGKEELVNEVISFCKSEFLK